jgi:hypothetical protein
METHLEEPATRPQSPPRPESLPRSGRRAGVDHPSVSDVSIVLRLLVLLSLWWGLVSIVGVFVTAERPRIARLLGELPWWADVLALVGAGLGISTPIVLVLTIQRLNRRAMRRRAP